MKNIWNVQWKNRIQKNDYCQGIFGEPMSGMKRKIEDILPNKIKEV